MKRERNQQNIFNLEKSNSVNNTIFSLKKEDASYTTSDTEILQEQYIYYQKLYTEGNIPENDKKEYIEPQGVAKMLNIDERQSLEGKISEVECEEAIRQMKTSKTPGSDGLPTEFYKQFWVHIKDILLKSLNEAYEKGELSYSQRRGIIKLLYKKNDKTLLNNWRPISLLNTDYKILAHVLANRLKNVIEKFINTDQTGYIKGRFIGQNIRVIQDVIDLLENNNTEGGILVLDFRKAFDTVNHKFLKKTLESAKFGSSFIRWIDTMYNNAEACVTNNGWTSKPFFIGRGIRQGCPLSALLFLLVVEVLANKIRKKQRIWNRNRTSQRIKKNMYN